MSPPWLLLSAFTGELRALYAAAEELDEVPGAPGLARVLLRQTPVLIGAIGIGAAAADGLSALYRAALAARLQPGAAVLAGCCGALRQRDRPGAAFAPRSILRPGAEPRSPDPQVQARLAGLAPGGLGVTIDAVARPEDKRRLGAETGADFVDMETWQVLGRAAELGLKLGALRVVSDAIDQEVPELPPDFDARGRPKIWAGAKLALRRPSSIPKLIKAGRGFAAAQRAIGEVLMAVITEPPPR